MGHQDHAESGDGGSIMHVEHVPPTFRKTANLSLTLLINKNPVLHFGFHWWFYIHTLGYVKKLTSTHTHTHFETNLSAL